VYKNADYFASVCAAAAENVSSAFAASDPD
jgi:hypothetical protein